MRLHGSANVKIVADFVRTQNPEALRDRLPGGMEITIVDSNGIVAASTEPGVRKGDSFLLDILVALSGGGGPAPRYFFDSVTLEGAPYTVITRLANLPGFICEGWLPALLFFLGAMVLGTALLSTLMLRRTSRAILTLGRAARNTSPS